VDAEKSVHFLPISVVYVTGGERKAEMIFDALARRYERVSVGYEHGRFFAWLKAEKGQIGRARFALPPVPRYVQLLYQWGRVMVCMAADWPRPWAVAICEGIQFSLVAPILRRMGVMKRWVYYAQDWWPDRPWLQRLDGWCASHADETWNISTCVARGREERWGKRLSSCDAVMEPLYEPQPAQTWRFNPSDMRCCYVGGIRNDIGLEWVIEALARLKAEGMAVHLDVIGKPIVRRAVDDLKRLCGIRGVEDQVHWHGFVPTEQMLGIVRKAGCGVAVFPGGARNYSNWAIPGKVREYIEAGVPVLISRANAMAQEIVEREAGAEVEDSSESIHEGLRKLFSNPSTLERYHVNAYALACEKACPDRLYNGIERVVQEN